MPADGARCVAAKPSGGAGLAKDVAAGGDTGVHAGGSLGGGMFEADFAGETHELVGQGKMEPGSRRAGGRAGELGVSQCGRKGKESMVGEQLGG